MIDSFIAGLVWCAVWIFVGHWYRWPKGDLDRLWAYGYGVGCIVSGQAVWLLATPQVQADGWRVFLQVAAFAVVGGGATLLGYGIDKVQKWWLRSVMSERPNKPE